MDISAQKTLLIDCCIRYIVYCAIEQVAYKAGLESPFEVPGYSEANGELVAWYISMIYCDISLPVLPHPHLELVSMSLLLRM